MIFTDQISASQYLHLCNSVDNIDALRLFLSLTSGRDYLTGKVMHEQKYGVVSDWYADNSRAVFDLVFLKMLFVHSFSRRHHIMIPCDGSDDAVKCVRNSRTNAYHVKDSAMMIKYSFVKNDDGSKDCLAVPGAIKPTPCTS